MAAQRIIDMDTHVVPALEVLERYLTPQAKERLPELQPYLRSSKDEGGNMTTLLRVNPIPYTRQLNQTATGTDQGSGPGSKGSLEGKTSSRGVGEPAAGAQHDDAKARLADMDREGVDVHLLIPGTWTLALTALDASVAVGLYDGYHRYAEDFCSADNARLHSLIMAPAADPEWSAAEIRRLASERWPAGVMVLLPEGLPVDDPSLVPIWSAMHETNLPYVYHSFFYEPPYFPGYRDIWGNLAVARTAAHPWGAQRVLAYLTLSGMFDRWPNLRIGFAETGAGWLPFWLQRLGMMQRYLPSAVPSTEHTPIEYVQTGQIYCGIQLYEGAEGAKAIVDLLGPDVLMYQSDYPHGECEWPESVKRAQSWEPALGAETTDKLMGGNAERFLRLNGR
jgi:predicted TIM-barrel fold metal-dependent hydrolase